jgi:hypothetical protein
MLQLRLWLLRGLVLVVVVVAGAVVVFVVVGVTAAVAGLAPAGEAAAPAAVLAPTAPGVPEVGVAVGVEAGKVVMGVGNGGKGLDNTLAIISFKPASDELCRNLYQVLKASNHSFLLAANFASVPAKATARA